MNSVSLLEQKWCNWQHASLQTLNFQIVAGPLLSKPDARIPSLTISHLLDKKPSDHANTNYIMLDELKDRRIEIYSDDPIFQFEQYDPTSRGITAQEFELDDCSLTLQLYTRFGWYLQMNGFSNIYEITSDIFHMTDEENINPENFYLTFDEENINFRVK